MKPLAPLLFAAIPLVTAVAAPVAQGPPYHFLKEIPIDHDTGWDYLTVDAPAHRLYVTHGTKVIVINTTTDTVAGTIEDTPGVHGVAIAGDLGRGFTSNGRENTSTIFDLQTLKPIQKVQTGANPDAILYEPSHHEVYTFNGRGRSATVFDAKTGNTIATVPLEGKPEFAQADAAAGKIYVNLEDKSTIAVIDTGTHAVIATWPIAPGEEASGMAYDAAHHRLFIGCSNKMMVMADSTNGRVIAHVPIGSGVDANAFDPATGFAFSSNGQGSVTIAREETPDTLRVVQTLSTRRGARTMALDPQTHRIYLAAMDGTFAVLVYQMRTAP